MNGDDNIKAGTEIKHETPVTTKNLKQENPKKPVSHMRPLVCIFDTGADPKPHKSWCSGPELVGQYPTQPDAGNPKCLRHEINCFWNHHPAPLDGRIAHSGDIQLC